MKVELGKLSKAKIENYTCRKCKLEIESGSGFVKDKVSSAVRVKMKNVK